MLNNDTRYYVLFKIYEHGMALHDLLLKDGIKHAVVAEKMGINKIMLY